MQQQKRETHVQRSPNLPTLPSYMNTRPISATPSIFLSGSAIQRPLATYLFPMVYAATAKRAQMHCSSMISRLLTTCYMCVGSQTTNAGMYVVSQDDSTEECLLHITNVEMSVGCVPVWTGRSKHATLIHANGGAETECYVFSSGVLLCDPSSFTTKLLRCHAGVM